METFLALLKAAKGCEALNVPSCIEIHLISRPQMVLFVDGVKTQTFPVAAGKLTTPTPRGNFYVYEHTDKVHWPKPNGGSYGPNHPRNAMQGGYYAAFMQLNGLPVAFHSTNAPGTVGTYASGGCISMKISDVKEVFTHVYDGMPVIIK